MKLEKSEARKMKWKILLWLRCDQRCAFIATEAGMNSADCLGINEKKMIEVEIKVTIEDLKNDFKKHKHYRWSHELLSYNQWDPTHFYFAVPARLIEGCQALLIKHGNENYGIINTDEMKIVRRAQWIHKNEPNSKVKFTLALRMGSELLRFHEAML